MPAIIYENEQTIEETDSQLNILEISLKHGIPHMHACGGNARCSTCRVMVTKHPENLTPRTSTELELADALGLDDSIRLSCQTKVTGPVTIRRLVIDDLDYSDIQLRWQKTTGREEKLAILFSDIRNFTAFSENRLPYDIIHILNRYFEAMAERIISNGGIVDKYIGDGLMAYFGLKDNDPVRTCLYATRAGLEMLQELEKVNAYARRHLNHEFKIGIGIHYGNVIVGELGHHSNASFTLIGDNVNVAARVESMNKKAKSNLLLSEDAYIHVKDYVEKGRKYRAPLKGKTGQFLLTEILSIDKEKASQIIQHGFELKVTNIEEIGTETKKVTFAKPPGFSFTPGQFLDLALNKDKTEVHSFSISSSRNQDEIFIVTRNTKSAYKTKLLTLPEGSIVYASESAGDLVLRREPNRTHVFLAGGIGVTPFHSIIQSITEESADYRLVLIHSARDEGSIVFKSDFETLAGRYEGFRYAPTLSKSVPPNWKYETGHINSEILGKYIPRVEACTFYIAGSPAFVSSMQEVLNKMGAPDTRVLAEEFYGY